MYWPTIESISNSSAFNILWVDSLFSETRIPTAILICYNFLLNINTMQLSTDIMEFSSMFMEYGELIDCIMHFI